MICVIRDDNTITGYYYYYYYYCCCCCCCWRYFVSAPYKFTFFLLTYLLTYLVQHTDLFLNVASRQPISVELIAGARTPTVTDYCLLCLSLDCLQYLGVTNAGGG